MLQDWVCPASYTPLAQIIVSIASGLIFSWLSASLSLLLLFLIIYEALYFAMVCRNRWALSTRIGVIAGYIAGWLIGRSIHKMETFYFNREFDDEHHIQCMYRRQE